MRKQSVVFLFLLLSLLTFGWCTTTAFADDGPPEWVATENFVPPEGAKRATDGFSGTVSFTTTPMNVSPTPEEAALNYQYPWLIWEKWGYNFILLQDQDPDPDNMFRLFELDATLFPGLSVEFFTTPQGDLVPVERGIIRKPLADRTESFWELIIGPGKTWYVGKDKRSEGWKNNKSKDKHWEGWNKAAFPFSLVQSQEGEALIALAYFYYKDDKVSNLFYQVSNDSAGGFIYWDVDFNMKAWGEVEFEYTPGTIGDKEEKLLQKAFRREVANRLPLRPLSDLGPAVDGMGGDVDMNNVLTMGLLVDGVLYHSPVETPFGVYPYPGEMRVGVWSASKSLIPGMASLRLAQKYGTDFLESYILDYFDPSEYDLIPDTEKRWGMVKIKHALHMATGMGPAGSGPNWAWDSTNTYLWSYSYALEDQIRFYFNQDVVPDATVTGPGQKLYYVDQDMWIAALCMERYLQAKEGPDATLLDMLREEVYQPIGVDHFVAGTGYTEGGEEGFPFSAWGALPTIDYLAKAGRLIANMGQAEDGTQILDSNLIANFYTNGEYQLAFWKKSFTNGDGETFYAPRMSGAGGNYVMSMPNGMVSIALGYNSYNFSWNNSQHETVMEAANELDPF